MQRPIAIVLSFCLFATTAMAQDEFKSMFNGKDLSGWKGNASLWSVKDGAITGTTNADDPIQFNTFLIWKDGTPGDFELQCQFKISSEGNSGIQYRSKVIDADKYIVGGYQADIDALLKFAGICYEEKGDGILCGRGERSTVKSRKDMAKEKFADSAKLGSKIKAGEWNDYRIVAKGNRLQHYINNALMSEVIDMRPDDKSSSEGVIALQLHKGPPMTIQFKDMKIKSL